MESWNWNEDESSQCPYLDARSGAQWFSNTRRKQNARRKLRFAMSWRFTTPFIHPRASRAQIEAIQATIVLYSHLIQECAQRGKRKTKKKNRYSTAVEWKRRSGRRRMRALTNGNCVHEENEKTNTKWVAMRSGCECRDRVYSWKKKKNIKNDPTNSIKIRSRVYE